jgi:hypothetical protein
VGPNRSSPEDVRGIVALSEISPHPHGHPSIARLHSDRHSRYSIMTTTTLWTSLALCATITVTLLPMRVRAPRLCAWLRSRGNFQRQPRRLTDAHTASSRVPTDGLGADVCPDYLNEQRVSRILDFVPHHFKRELRELPSYPSHSPVHGPHCLWHRLHHL